MSHATAPAPETSIWKLCWRVSQHEPRSFWIGWITFVVFFTMPAINGYLLGRGFDALNDGDTSAVYRFAIALAVVEVTRMAVIHYAAIMWTKAWVHMQTILRGNLLAAQMASGGPEAGQPVGSAGEAITHFRDDAEDVAQLVDGIVDVSAGLVFSVAAGVILGLADARAAAVLLIPTRRCRARHQGRRHPDQGVPGRRPRGDRRRDRAGRRHDGGRDHGQGQRRCRQHAGAAQGRSSTAAASRRSATGCSARACSRSARGPPTSASD